MVAFGEPAGSASWTSAGMRVHMCVRMCADVGA